MIEKVKISQHSSLFFIGIGGIGMSALARYFAYKGKIVSGYDKVETTLTRKLVDEGIEIHYEDNPDLIREDIDLVVFTPAIPEDHLELQWCRKAGIPVFKRSEVLGLLSQEKRTIAVAGTHGKTSTSSIIAHNLTYSGSRISAFIGGIMKNFDSNFVQGNSDWLVVEADEYDRSFLTLNPEVSVLISVDPDHLDIYGDHINMIQGFRSFLLKTKEGGTIIMHERVAEKLGEDFVLRIRKDYAVFLYSRDLEKGICKEIEGLGNHFLTGDHNIENALAARIVSAYMGHTKENFLLGLQHFKGIKRRFELVYESPRFLYIDDYAHHPSEIKEVVSAIKKLAQGKRICGIFQPHLYTRTRDFEDGFAAELSKLDTVVLLDIYPAREEAIPGVSSDNIFEKLTSRTKIRSTKEQLVDKLESHLEDVILSIGAGDIDTCVPEIKKLLSKIDEGK